VRFTRRQCYPRQVRRQNLRRNDKNAIAFGIDKNFVNITAGFKREQPAVCRRENHEFCRLERCELG
jgi:hypothetical protein